MPGSGEAYALPLEVLLTVIQAVPMQQRFLLQATVSSTLFPATSRRSEKLEVKVLVAQGKLETCQIFDQHQTLLLEGQAALERLWSNEQIVWSVQSVQEKPRPGIAPTRPALVMDWDQPPNRRSEEHVVPVRRSELAPERAKMLTHKQRQLFLLIDGRRSVSELRALLCASFEQVTAMLDELERQGFIFKHP